MWESARERAADARGDRRIECGCCIAGSGVANVNPRSVGAAGMSRIARFAMDPRDARTDAQEQLPIEGAGP